MVALVHSRRSLCPPRHCLCCFLSPCAEPEIDTGHLTLTQSLVRCTGAVQLQAQREACAPGVSHPGLPRQVLLPPHGHHEQALLRRHPDPLPPQTRPGLRLLTPSGDPALSCPAPPYPACTPLYPSLSPCLGLGVLRSFVVLTQFVLSS